MKKEERKRKGLYSRKAYLSIEQRSKRKKEKIVLHNIRLTKRDIYDESLVQVKQFRERATSTCVVNLIIDRNYAPRPRKAKSLREERKKGKRKEKERKEKERKGERKNKKAKRNFAKEKKRGKNATINRWSGVLGTYVFPRRRCGGIFSILKKPPAGRPVPWSIHLKTSSRMQLSSGAQKK